MIGSHTSMPSSTRASRIPALDVARGIAIAAMISYHFMWDLYFTGFWHINAATDPMLRLYAKAIAASFLTLVGIGLVLAHGNGMRWHSFIKRLGMIVAAALVVTVGSYFAFPDSYIFFGILHCIALSSVLALPFLRAPVWLVLVAAVIAFAMPWAIAAPVFEAPWALWLGLGIIPPLSNDYVPIFPWFGFVLMGIALWRLNPAHAKDTPRWQPHSVIGRVLVFTGQHSLIIYLTHQIVLIGILVGLASLLRPL
ncbi:heparan-alpha-glucosaminide N-acetyltransferase [Pseudochelatococcus sp. G4_1912]|uniref:heparan-alpha-glucosaminide N-acetyltransferase n=1 Tax=Pseudochelatococcus sp. G4_1912 TaxID=3114288 RepID=UPI0039C737B0